MTNEEAIQSIEDIRQKFLRQYGEETMVAVLIDGDDMQAFDAAISALKERPKELTLSEVETYANEHNYVLWTDEMSEKALALIKADRDRPKGKWNVVSDGYGNNAYICECSECKDTVWVYKDTDRTWNFCPNCGADMRGE